MGKKGSGTTGYSTAAVLMVCPEDRPADFFSLRWQRTGGLSHDQAAIGRVSRHDAGLR